MRFVVLGPVEVHSNDGRVLTLPRRQERCLLAILLLEVGRAVPTTRLADLVWDGEPPDLATRALASMASRIRALLTRAGATEDGVELLSYRGGYLLKASPEMVDVHQFRQLLDAAAGTDDLSERERLLRAAVALWRGPALCDVASDRVRQRLCADLDRLHLQAVEEAAATALSLGRHGGVLPELARFVGEHPAQERLAELYMLALYRAGRTADALDVYSRTRSHLARELGLEPGAALRKLHTDILRGEPVATPPEAPRPAATEHVPAQLPTDVAGFAGRVDELHQLDELYARPGGKAVVIATITGPAGVGKTALAVHWAHRVRDRFPDGQLYANLAGFDPAADPVAPVDVVRRFLVALNVPPQRIPADPDAQVGLYRTLLAGKRVLVVLDNARDPDQVRPLLPGTSGCFVLVTSRRRLTGLVAVDAAHPLALDLLSIDEARELLAGRIGAERVAAEPDAAAALVAACARLPLALAIAAAQAAMRPGVPLATINADIRVARSALDAFTGDDTATDIRAVFASSYRALSPPAARLFRLLGTHPGPDISTAAATSLAGLPHTMVEPLLHELSNANVLLESAPGRYTFHDLLRAYALEQAGGDSADELSMAKHRLLDHYLHTAYGGARLLHPAKDPITVAPPVAGATPETFTGTEQALRWFDTECSVLLTAAEFAAGTGFPRHTWQLAWALGTYLDVRGRWHDEVAAQHRAIAATRQLGLLTEEAWAHRSLSRSLLRLGRLEDSFRHLEAALDLYRRSGDLVGQAHTHLNIGATADREGRHSEALDRAVRALELFKAADHRPGQANALNAIGWSYSQLGDHEQALAHCEQALARHQENGSPVGAATTWDSIGNIHRHLGNFQEAVRCLRNAIDMHREFGDQYYIAGSLSDLGDVHDAMGDVESARTAWQQALTILDELGHADAAQLRRKLA